MSTASKPTPVATPTGTSGADSVSSQVRIKRDTEVTAGVSGYSGSSGTSGTSGSDNVGRQDADKQNQPVNVPSTSGNSGATGSGISSGTSGSGNIGVQEAVNQRKPLDVSSASGNSGASGSGISSGASGASVSTGKPSTSGTSGIANGPSRRSPWYRRLFSWF
jgi:hypothetical protein